MATAIIPLIVSAASSLLPEIPKIIQAIEGLFGAKTGATKLQVAIDMVTVAANQLAAAGKINGIPTVDTILALVESVVQGLNARGQLGKGVVDTQVTSLSVVVAGVQVDIRKV